MPRNFDRRIEIAFPIVEPRLQAKLKQILELQLGESMKGWSMQPDGSYKKIENDDRPAFRFQERFYELLQAEERLSSSTALGASDWHNCQPDDFPYAFAAADSE
jgi:polyphosphate kinase